MPSPFVAQRIHTLVATACKIYNLAVVSGHRASTPKSRVNRMWLQARELNLPLRVTCISPGVVQTEFFEVSSFGSKDAGKSKYAAIGMKPLQPHDIASAVIWCLTAPDHMDVNDILIRPTAQRS